MRRTDFIGKDPDAGKDWRLEKGTTEHEVVGWHQWLNGHVSEQAPGIGDGQGSLGCCSPWFYKESDRTERLNWPELGTNILRAMQHDQKNQEKIVKHLSHFPNLALLSSFPYWLFHIDIYHEIYRITIQKKKGKVSVSQCLLLWKYTISYFTLVGLC